MQVASFECWGRLDGSSVSEWWAFGLRLVRYCLLFLVSVWVHEVWRME